MIETRRLRNVVIFFQTILSLVLSRKIANCDKLICTLKINNSRHSYQRFPERKPEFVTKMSNAGGKNWKTQCSKFASAVGNC